ncbi:septation protein SepH [Brachybacterium horti]
MRELELDGIHDDGEHLILLDSDGERYTLRIDEALRAAVRRDRPALGMIQAADAAPLSPRQIQGLLRSGRSAEEIAELAAITVEHVRRYEGPVLAEREWTAGRARTFPVGRGGPSLTSVVSERLAARQADEDVAWDAWRRPDGTWTLELSFNAAGRTRQAHWVADLDNRSLAPVDDEARWISDEDAPVEPSRGRTRLMAVKSSVYDLEADGSFDESAGPRRGAAERSAHPAAFDEAELDALNARRGLRSVPPLEDDDSAGVWSTLDEDVPRSTPSRGITGPADNADVDVDRGLDADPDLDAQRDHAGTAPEEEDPFSEDLTDDAATGPSGEGELEDEDGAPAPEPLQYQDTVDLTQDLTPLPGFDDPRDEDAGATEDPSVPDAPGADGHDVDTAESTGKPEQKSAPAPKKASKPAKKGRASMPSWDEIVFGAKHD